MVMSNVHANAEQQQMALQRFISEIYTDIGKIDLAEYRQYALGRLQQVIDFDGAIWSNGHQKTLTFHNQTLFNVAQQLSHDLLQYLDINPLADVLLQQLGQPIDMRDLCPDSEFYQSQIYQKCFSQHGIERILSSIHLDEQSGLFTLLSLYRFDRQRPFSEQDKKIQQIALYHLLTAANHALFMALPDDKNQPGFSAICDDKGYLHQVQSEFLPLLAQFADNLPAGRLPFLPQNLADIEGLSMSVAPFDDRYLVQIRATGPLASLSEREQQVVTCIVQGQTFKQAAKSLQLSPSTVSNHLYRVYKKLNIGSKSELIALVKQSDL
ncbi:helix-turn-helix transcriptional regulator [Thalassotalea sp. Y01]|nr:helix-turn-helix transcriptional regulator [Thalassotalea sp. Y01]